MKRTFFLKNLVDKKIVRKLALAVMAAVLCAYCSESGVLTASAASRSVTMQEQRLRFEPEIIPSLPRQEPHAFQFLRIVLYFLFYIHITVYE